MEKGFTWDNASFVEPLAAILEEIYQRRPEHPGVVHYLIHVYDSRTFAPRGLHLARLYSRLAPASSHALHMPSHIFRWLGMWAEMAASDEDVASMPPGGGARFIAYRAGRPWNGSGGKKRPPIFWELSCMRNCFWNKMMLNYDGLVRSLFVD